MIKLISPVQRALRVAWHRMAAHACGIGAIALLASFAGGGRQAHAEGGKPGFVHIAELGIKPEQMGTFKRLAQDLVQGKVSNDPHVLAFLVVAEKDDPGRVRIVEIYTDEAAHRDGLLSPISQRFSAATKDMVVSRKSYDAAPVLLGAKPALPKGDLLPRMAEIDIEPAQLNAYKAALSEEISSSIRVEPGVLAIYAVSLLDKPASLRFLEIYADDDAYRSHIASPHFRKYVEATKSMITSRRLLEAEPIAFGVKAP